ncbi:hypothetical protein BDW68DRAFT_167821 [Aspergillus falconensis]
MLSVQVAGQNRPYDKTSQQTVMHVRSFHMTVGQLRAIASNSTPLGSDMLILRLGWSPRRSCGLKKLYMIHWNNNAWRTSASPRRSPDTEVALPGKIPDVPRKLVPTVIDSLTLHAIPARQLRGTKVDQWAN